ncbi:hypothetical protein L7F22_037742 [Adiantum nelumboides]|nr:hypothetical protein [Adiantum nelumboides]
MTLEETFTGRKPNVSHFKVFGCIAYVHVRDALRTKLDPKAEKCVFIGYSVEQKGYKCYNHVTRQVRVSKDVVFEEMETWYADVKDVIGADVNKSVAENLDAQSQVLSGPQGSPASSHVAISWSGRLRKEVSPASSINVSRKGKEKVDEGMRIPNVTARHDDTSRAIATSSHLYTHRVFVERLRESKLTTSKSALCPVTMDAQEGSLSYEDIRKQRLEENKKRMKELGLADLSKNLSSDFVGSKATAQPRQAKPRIPKEFIEIRRSSRVAANPAPDYREVDADSSLGRRSGGYSSRVSSLLNRKYASDEARLDAVLQAETIMKELPRSTPSFVKPMLQSHTTGGFWLGLPSNFCKTYLPKKDDKVVLENEKGDEWETVYLANKTGLSGGWRGFSLDHGLVDGDALVFELVEPCRFKIHIVRASEEAQDNDDPNEDSGEELVTRAETQALAKEKGETKKPNKSRGKKNQVLKETVSSKSNEESGEELVTRAETQALAKEKGEAKQPNKSKGKKIQVLKETVSPKSKPAKKQQAKGSKVTESESEESGNESDKQVGRKKHRGASKRSLQEDDDIEDLFEVEEEYTTAPSSRRNQITSYMQTGKPRYGRVVKKPMTCSDTISVF